MGEVPADVMEATWVDIASFSDSRGRSETKKAQREQPYLFEFLLGATEHLSPPVHALGFYIFLVICQAFRRATKGKIPRVTAGAIERRRQENEQALSRYQGADERFLERAAATQISHEPAVFRYMVEALIEAPDDPDDPVRMTEAESGTLFLVLQVAMTSYMTPESAWRAVEKADAADEAQGGTRTAG
jgi:hypothetical protein